MNDLLALMRQRLSSRVAFDCQRPIAEADLRRILEAARWAPTAHNMQNFEILVVDDEATLEQMGRVESPISEEFIRDNYAQMSFSEAELRREKVGVLATMFPPSWRNVGAKLDLAAIARERTLAQQSTRETPVLLIVLSDSRKRAPGSQGDVLGIISLGCVLENMWLMAQSLEIGFQVLSSLSAPPTESELRRILGFPEYLKVAVSCRLVYPTSAPEYLRVRREVDEFTHRDRFANRGLAQTR